LILKPSDFDKKSLFNELTFVIKVSNQLVSSLEKEINWKQIYGLGEEDDVKIGLCLMESSENIKMTYAKYLQNHSNIGLQIKKVFFNLLF